MKKSIFKSLLFATLTTILLVCGFVSASAVSTTECTEPAIEVSTYEQLKNALQDFTDGQNIVLKNDITVNDDSKDYSINIDDTGAIALDFNGYQLQVTSSATKYLFRITGQSKIFFVNSNINIDGSINRESVVYFNTTKPGAALVRADYKFCEVTNLNVKFYMGNTSGYKETTDKSETAVFSVNKATQMNIYGGVVNNGMTNGNGVVIAETSENKTYLEFRVGGRAKIQAKKYCISFNPSYVKFENFSSVILEGNGSYERIKVPSDSTLTVKTLWYTAEAGTSTTVYCGALPLTSLNKKITDLSKADITADKTCDVLNNTDYFVVLICAGGHVQICGSCQMSYNKIEPHDKETVSGSSAGCTYGGLTKGFICNDCDYTSQKYIPPTGHTTAYRSEVPASCGVDGTKAHYYCKNCSLCFYDSEGKSVATQSDLIIKNNHKFQSLSYVAPTCTQDGLTSGTKCLTCGRVVQSQQIIPKTNHSYPSYWTEVFAATCSSTGLKVKVCTSCKNELREEIPKRAHTYDENGNCTVCEKNINDPDPEPEPGTNPGQGSDNNNVNCSCSCHKDGLKKFLFKIILFFQKIFGLNQYCKECGVAHY